jgi:hypothetical protein
MGVMSIPKIDVRYCGLAGETRVRIRFRIFETATRRSDKKSQEGIHILQVSKPQVCDIDIICAEILQALEHHSAI